MDEINEKIHYAYLGVLKEAAGLDKESARELSLFVDNDGDLYRQMVTPWIKNLIAKIARGQFNYKKAKMGLAKHLFTEGAKRYTKQYATGDYKQIFNKATIEAAAEEWLIEFLDEAELGNYDNHLPKKYQKDGTTGQDYSKLRK